MRGVGVLARVLVRRNRVMLLSWTLGLIALVAVTIPSYAAAYPSLSDRAPLVAEMRATVATKVLYGPLPSPGTLGQLAQWETGTYLTILAAVLGILLAVRLGPAEEHAGTTEVVRATGSGRSTPVVAAMTVLTATFVTIGAGIGAILAWQSRSTAEVSLSGSWHLAAVVALVGLGSGMSTLCLAQVLPSPSAARSAGWAVLGACFVVRVIADFAPAPALRWFTWLGLRDLVAPFTDDRDAPLAVTAGVIVLLAGVVVGLDGRRELGAGLVAPFRASRRPVSIRSPLALAWRLGSVGFLGWASATVAIAALFGGMSYSLITLSSSDAATSTFIGSVTGEADPVRQYFALSVIFIALVPLVHAVARVLSVREMESSGLLDVELATGVDRWRPLGAQAVLSAAQSCALLLLGGLVQGGVAAAVDGGENAVRWAFGSVVIRTPGVLAAVGITTLLVALVPRLSRLAWLVVVWSGFASLLGGLVRLPDWAIRSSLLDLGLRSVTGPVQDLARWGTAGLLVAIALATSAVGIAVMSRRDIRTAIG